MSSFFDRTTLIGLLAGVVVGALGASYYRKHEDEINAKLREFKCCGHFGKSLGETVEQGAELTLEELESQKERLEDLIADLQERQKKQK